MRYIARVLQSSTVRVFFICPAAMTLTEAAPMADSALAMAETEAAPMADSTVTMADSTAAKADTEEEEDEEEDEDEEMEEEEEEDEEQEDEEQEKKKRRCGCGSNKKRCGCDSKEAANEEENNEQKPPWRGNRFNREEHSQILEEFCDRRAKSEGFDVPKLPFLYYDNLWPVEKPEEIPLIAEMAEFAVEEHNKTLEKQGRKMELIRIIKVMEEVHCGLKHAMTLEVKFSDEEKPRNYEARTWKRGGKELLLIREARVY